MKPKNYDLFPAIKKEIKEVEESEKQVFNELERYKVCIMTNWYLAQRKSSEKIKAYWERIKQIEFELQHSRYCKKKHLI